MSWLGCNSIVDGILLYMCVYIHMGLCSYMLLCVYIGVYIGLYIGVCICVCICVVGGIQVWVMVVYSCAGI